MCIFVCMCRAPLKISLLSGVPVKIQLQLQLLLLLLCRNQNDYRAQVLILLQN